MGTDAWGIDDGWEDTSRAWHEAPRETIESIRAAMTADPPVLATGTARREPRPSPQRPGGGPPVSRPVWVVRPGQEERLVSRCRLVLEGGDDAGDVDELPRDLPLGIHELTPLDGGPTTHLIVSPRRCHLPGDLRTWGVTMQVPTTRSRSSWGIGDLADVRAVGKWVASLGGGALGLSPLHAPTPVAPLQRSPYYPSSRRWRSPLLLRVDEVPGAAGLAEVGHLAARARRLLDEPIVDRDRGWAIQRQALEVLWARRSDRQRDELARWRDKHGGPLEGWARYCALAEAHGPGWADWPAELRHPAYPAVDDAATELADRIAFHAWLQLLANQQLDGARVDGVRLVQDLAIGVDPDGADAWLLQDLLALGTSVGAPPDDFAPEGQSWGLPPFIPWRLRDAGYRPLAELLRASMAEGGGLRVDHVMGLARIFWIPERASPADGTYVRFAGRELLDVLAMESARAGAVVVGEDLGTVEEGFRHELHETAVLSTRLVWFEDRPPGEYPQDALAMVTTHDLPTIAGASTGADDAELSSLGRTPPADATTALRRRLEALVGPSPSRMDPTAVAGALHSRLARSSARMVLATLEDLCGVPLRPNVPGTTDDERPNWSQALPVLVDDLPSDPHVRQALGDLPQARTD